MSRIEEKLEHFANDVMSDVGEERRILVDQVDEELRQLYEEKEIEYLTTAYEIIQDSLVKIDQKKNESLSRIIIGNRTRLFEKRNELLKGIYSKVVDELKAYKTTEAYKSHLIKQIEASKELLGEGDIWVVLDYSDRDLQVFVEETSGCSVELESKRVQLIGGCIVQNRTTQTIVDNAFSRKLEDAKVDFVQQCQLEID